MRTFIIIIFSIMLLSTGSSASDQFDNDYPLLAQFDNDKIDNKQPGERREEMHRRFEQLKLIKMLELLNLDEDSEAEFISLYRQHSKEMKEIMKTRKELIMELSQLVRSTSDDQKKYDEIFNEINNIDIKQMELIHSHFNQLKTVLTNEQIGKMYIFHDRFGPELMGRIRNLRGQKPGERGMKKGDRP